MTAARGLKAAWAVAHWAANGGESAHTGGESHFDKEKPSPLAIQASTTPAQSISFKLGP